MKIVYVVFDYHRPSGMERVLSSKVNFLVNKGYDVSIIALSDKHKEPFFKFDPRIKFYDLGLADDTLKYKYIFLSKLEHLLMRMKPDITISTGLGIAKYAYEIKDGSKKILEIHFAKYKRKFELAYWDKYRIGRLFNDFFYRKMVSIVSKYDKFIILTEEDKEYWRNLTNIEVIPNPISFQLEGEQASLQNKQAIALGRYTYQKGFDLLIDIWAETHKTHPDWKLAIYGHGRKKKDLESQIKRLGLSDVVTLHDPTADVEEKLTNSSIYVMTSRYEGQGLVILEAMASGLPVIAYSCKCGPKDIINDGENGYLIETFNRKRYVQKLNLLMDDSNLRLSMGKTANIEVYKKFNIDYIMGKWTNLFDELIATK